MTNQKFSNGDRIKVTFEADVSYASLDDINYITFSNGEELEFPAYLLPDDVLIEKIEKPLESGRWYLVRSERGVETVKYYFEGQFYLWKVDSSDTRPGEISGVMSSQYGVEVIAALDVA